MSRRYFASATAVLLLSGICHADTDQVSNALAHDLFRQLIEINTTESVGSVTAASEAMAKRLGDAGFAPADIQILGPNERKKNLVVRLHGLGKHAPYTSAAGLPTYNISGVAIDKDNIRAHGQDENVGVESFDRGNEFFYRYMKLITEH